MLGYSCKSVLVALLFVLATQSACHTNPFLRQDGFGSIRAGEYEAARDKFAEAVDRHPADYSAQYHLGVAELKLGNLLAAQLALEKALTLRPDDRVLTPKILDELAEALFQQGRYESLYSLLVSATRNYRTTGAYLRQGEYLARSGDLDGAKVAFQKAAYFAERTDADPYLAIADFYESINDVPNSVKALRYAYYVYPQHPDIPDRFRKFGLVPGPTLRSEPPKPELLHGPVRTVRRSF